MVTQQSNSEQDRRQRALNNAIAAGRVGDTDQAIVERADAFYKFLEGDE